MPLIQPDYLILTLITVCNQVIRLSQVLYCCYLGCFVFINQVLVHDKNFYIAVQFDYAHRPLRTFTVRL